jgi:hypothetical protein
MANRLFKNLLPFRVVSKKKIDEYERKIKKLNDDKRYWRKKTFEKNS